MKKAIGIIGIILAIVFLCLAINTSIPKKYISSYSMTEYVGGDAYNFIIEASLRGGEIAGAQITKAIYFAVSAILLMLSLPCFVGNAGQTPDVRSELKQISEWLKSIKTSHDGKEIETVQVPENEEQSEI